MILEFIHGQSSSFTGSLEDHVVKQELSEQNTAVFLGNECSAAFSKRVPLKMLEFIQSKSYLPEGHFLRN